MGEVKVYPVLIIGDSRETVHETGAQEAERFGARYGVEGWRQGMSVHTYSMPAVGTIPIPMYAYLALIPVAAARWDEIWLASVSTEAKRDGWG